jgi:hypothetical protein
MGPLTRRQPSAGDPPCRGSRRPPTNG